MSTPDTLSTLRQLGRQTLGAEQATDVDWLLCEACQISRATLLAFAERPVDPPSRQQFLDWLEQRQNGTPVAYLLGRREFWTLSLCVSPATLIPRPETEHLVERALAVLPLRPARVIDPGTGSGAIALALASERPDDQIVALDRSTEALAVAAINRQRLALSQVQLLAGDWLDAVAERPEWDLIVSNPPYVAQTDAHLDQGDCRFEPRIALTDGADGLSAIETLCRQGRSRLRPGGWLLLEHGHDQAGAVRERLHQHGYREVASWPDLAGIERISGGRK